MSEMPQNIETSIVNSLKSMNGNGWDYNILIDLLNTRVKNAILIIVAFVDNKPRDRIIWTTYKGGDYTVPLPICFCSGAIFSPRPRKPLSICFCIAE